MIELKTKKGRDHRDVWVFHVEYHIVEEIPGMSANELTAVSVKTTHTAFIPALNSAQVRSMVRSAHKNQSISFQKVDKVGGWNAHWVN